MASLGKFRFSDGLGESQPVPLGTGVTSMGVTIVSAKYSTTDNEICQTNWRNRVDGGRVWRA